tara:strand:- start:19 stop:249 length:231 start_codon:yes stop_codon:yes gene_type:complete
MFKLFGKLQVAVPSNDFHSTILSKVLYEKRGYILFYKRDIIMEMKMKSICGHSNSEGKEPPLLNSFSDCGVEQNRE